MQAPSIANFAEKLEKSGIEVDRELPGSQLTTYRIGGPIAYFVRLKTRGQLNLLAECISDGFVDVFNQKNVCLVGNGSNLLIDDGGFEGFVFTLEDDLAKVDDIEQKENEQMLVSAGAGLSLPLFARQIMKSDLGGLEFYVGIPGTIGGAVAMNAGGHGKQTSDVLQSVKVLDLKNGQWVTYSNEQCEFRYRGSRFTPTDMVVSASFEGITGIKEKIKNNLDEIVTWRRENQPGGRNVGSVFQNPEDISAGALIEKCGLKGYSIGGASVSEKHANFIQAEQDTKAKDIRDLIAYIRETVLASTGYELKTEVRYISSHE